MGQFDNAHKTEPPPLTQPHGTNQLVLTHRSESSTVSVAIVRTPHQSVVNNGRGDTFDPAAPVDQLCLEDIQQARLRHQGELHR